jgi:hypothetical protein
MDKINISENIVRLRRKKRITQEQLEKDIVQMLHNPIFTEVLDGERLKVYEGMNMEYG